MPALPIIANTFRCSLNWNNGAGQIAVNVIHVRSISGSPAPSDVFEALDDSVTAAMWSSIGAGAVITEVGITPLDGITATQFFSTASAANWGGGGVGQVLPAVACLVSLRTPSRGRSHRGRIYIPFTSEAAVDTGMIVSATISAAQPAWTTFLTTLSTLPDFPHDLVVASYKLGSAEDVTNAFVETPCATQRRRQGRLRSA